MGDHVILQGGNKIPADGMLIAGELRVNNTALNGETEECPKAPADSSYAFPEEITGDAFVDDATLFRGAVVFDGEGVMEVRRVGTETMMGRMASEMQAREPDSPLQVKLAKLADQIAAFGYISSVGIISLYMMFFALRAGGLEAYVMLGWSQIFVDLIQAVSLAILIIVCAVPEGLPLMISLVLMQNTSRMLARGVLVRRAVGIGDSGLAEHPLQRQDGDDHGRAARGRRLLHGGRDRAFCGGAGTPPAPVWEAEDGDRHELCRHV